MTEPKMTEDDKKYLDKQDLTPNESNGLPEAPASANLVCWVDGFRVQLTVRGEKAKDVISRLEYLINYAKENKWQPDWKKGDKDPDWIKETKAVTKCPICGSEMVERTRKKDGKKFFGCSNFPNCKGIIDPNEK